MAVLNKIRQQGVFLIIIIALALFAFVLSGLIDNGGFSSKGAQNTVATINDQDISRQEFAKEVEAYQRNTRGNATTTQAVNQVWNTTLRKTLLQGQVEELGIDVGQGQVNHALRQQFQGNPNFTNEAGVFDEAKLREYIANLKATSPQAYEQWLNVEDNVAEQAKANIYFSLVQAGVSATLDDAEQNYKMENDKVDIKFVNIPFLEAKKVEVSKSDIKSYLKKHSEKYQTEASEDIQYVLFKETPSSTDKEAVKKQITDLLNKRVVYNEVTKQDDTLKGFKNTQDNEVFLSENSDTPYQKRYTFKDQLPSAQADKIFGLSQGDTYGPYENDGFWKVDKVTDSKKMPDSVEVKHILISYKGLESNQDDSERTEEEAKKLADSILGVVKKEDKKFSVLATTFSADNNSKSKGGELGWVDYRNTTPSPLIDYIFNANEGDMSVIKTDFGYHVVAVEKAKNKQKAISLATLEKKIEPSEKTLNDLFTKTTKFQIAAEKDDFNEVAKKQDLKARPVKGIEVMQENLPGLGSERRIVQWAFEEDSNPGDIKRFDVPQGYVVVQLTATHKKGLMSVEQASSEITPLIRKKKQGEMIEKTISGNSLESIAKKHNSKVETANGVTMKDPLLPGVGNEPEVVGAAFGLKADKLSKPIIGKKGVFVVQLIEKREVAPLDSYKTLAQQQSQKNAAVVSQQLINSLEENAEIQDNRAKFY